MLIKSKFIAFILVAAAVLSLSYFRVFDFSDLRTYGAFLVSAKLQNGSVTQVEIRAESGGEIVLEDPFKGVEFSCDKAYTKEGENLVFKLGKGESASLK